MRKQAFTLAEVLLTLAIIGVVAALTIPAVITKVTQDQYVVGLKKAYNTLKSVEREAREENGSMEHWDWTLSGIQIFKTYFMPHFDILKDCGVTTDDGCFGSSYKFLNDMDWATNLNSASFYKITTSDGISYTYQKNVNPAPGRQGMFYVDLNGKKGPNKFGRDVFEFTVFPTLGIKPHGGYGYNGVTLTKEEVDERCSTTSSNASAGNWCAAKVLAEGAMNY